LALCTGLLTNVFTRDWAWPAGAGLAVFGAGWIALEVFWRPAPPAPDLPAVPPGGEDHQQDLGWTVFVRPAASRAKVEAAARRTSIHATPNGRRPLPRNSLARAR
jgi:hypothetical protein